MIAHEDADFQRRATVIGKAFESLCNDHLISLSFTLLGRKKIAEAGIEIDQVAINAKRKKIYFSFVGGLEGDRPGLMRTDTTKKVLCNAFLMRECALEPFVVIASVKPDEASSSGRMIRTAGNVIYDLISLSIPKDRSRLKELLDISDFSRVLSPAARQKVKLAHTINQAELSSTTNRTFQVAWHPDLKTPQVVKRRPRADVNRNKNGSAEEQPVLFDKD